MKRLVRELCTRPPVVSLFDWLAARRVVVLMLHRFAEGPNPNGRHDIGRLRAAMEHLRRRRQPVLSLKEVAERVREGAPLPKRAVVFTVDDGYADFVELALPVFRQFDCPVTVFVTTDFVDGRTWLWWDRIGYVFRHTHHRATTIRDNHAREVPLRSDRERADAAAAFAQDLVWTSPNAREHRISDLAHTLEVDIPRKAPLDYASMTWQQVQAAEDAGVTFGPHTLDHPTLSAIPDAEECRRQILRSYRRLVEQTKAPLPVFCYPNGDARSFGQREVSILATAGFELAVSAVPGYLPCGPNLGGWSHAARYSLPRFPYNDDPTSFRQVISGVERIRHAGTRLRAAQGVALQTPEA